MAGLDKLKDARGYIQNYIEEKVRELLSYPMNEYQDPSWVQAALLFEQTVVPCGYYMMEHLYKLALDIVNEAEKHGSKWVSQIIPRTYNEKSFDSASTPMENIPLEVTVNDYSDTVKNIKNWMKIYDENRIDFHF